MIRASADEKTVENLSISRLRAATLSEQTVSILRHGSYITNSGRSVELGKLLDRARSGTIEYSPDDAIQASSIGQEASTEIEVQNVTTLQAALSLRSLGHQPAVLNMASAYSPGGGFLSGARAQEEYLARSTALWFCLQGRNMYRYHQQLNDPFHSDYVIYSPDVPVLRNDEGGLLEEPWCCDILSAAAVQAKQVRELQPDRVNQIKGAMRQRITRLLTVARFHGIRNLVLGAWGCGAFGNCGADISYLFGKAIRDEFCGDFDRCVFAITDWSPDLRFIGPFLREFSSD